MPSKRTPLIAAGTAVAGILIGILVASPSQWKGSLAEWLSVFTIVFMTLWPIFLALLSLAFGLLLGRFVFPDPSRMVGTRPNIMHESEFSNTLQAIVGQHHVNRIDVLSYTNETVADVLKYEYRNKEGLLIRVLSRSWFEERADESAYNLRLTGSKKRRWHKADMIERIALTPWNNVGAREQRFYWGMHPLLKAIVVHCDNCRFAFLTIYDWQEWPAEGGAPFKGANHVGVFLDSRSPMDESLIGYIDNQFSFIWEYQSHDAHEGMPQESKSVFDLAKETTSPDGTSSRNVHHRNR